ncbi:hypothetical protein CP973_35120 [Streptomyces albofaciens JCM 4342]|uniref:hypothetical protein n=1 Tax=Streptomyces albofaciens TaxID=66866 RepID=UPI00123C554A|nr:hypothetical protein [Streptomyces albofaciens]KAA6214340.1 hypothetical protein CP973_35120 [Streptomyces albofaciens JCM 4342]
MTVLTARRRTLRTAVASAALGAALLGPASGAFAATPATAAPAAAAKPVPDGAGRYAGQPVYIGKGMVAVLRNVPSEGGPEAWIRYVGPQWKSGDWYMVRVLGLLDRDHPTARIKGLHLRLSGVSGASPTLHVGGGSRARTYPLPKSGAPSTGGKVAGKETGGRTGKHGQGGKADGGHAAVPTAHKPGGTASDRRKSCSVTRRVAIGGGTLAALTNSSKGPRVTFEDGPGNAVPGVFLDRAHPTLARFGAKIVNPYSARPTFRFKMQGGSYPPGYANFPALPKGCAPAAKPGKDGASGGTHAVKATENKGTAAPTGAPAAPAHTQTKALPKGAVAAGYDAPEAPDTTPLFAAGGAFAAAGAAGVVFAVRRRRQSEGSWC